MKRSALALLFLCGPAFASEGTTGAASLKLSAGARGQGFGDAYVAAANGVEALYWNPAGLVIGPERSLVAGFQPMAEDIATSQLAMGARFGRIALAGGYASVAADGLDAFDTVGNQTGNFDAKDQTLSAAVAFGGAAFSVGVAGKMWTSNIDGVSAEASMADIGVAFQNPLFSRVRHGAVMRHVGGDVSYVSQKDPLPTVATFGTAVRIGRAILVTADLGHEKESGGFVGGGAEWGAVTKESFSIALRGGYNSRRTDTGDLGGLAAGATLSWKALAIDYAWIPFGDIGNSHSVALRLQFDPSARRFKDAEEPAKKSQDKSGADAVVAPVVPVKSKIEEPETKSKPIRKPVRRRLSTLETPARR